MNADRWMGVVPAPLGRECGATTEQDDYGCGEDCRRERGHDGVHMCLCGETAPDPAPRDSGLYPCAGFQCCWKGIVGGKTPENIDHYKPCPLAASLISLEFVSGE